MDHAAYAKIEKQASQLAELSTQLGTEIGKLEVISLRINQHWSGPASTEFQSQLKKTIETLKISQRNITHARDDLNRAKDRYW